MPKAKPTDHEQHARFVETTRKLGCDESEEAFDEKLKAIARHKPKNEPDEITDAAVIHEMTKTRLEKIGADESGWIVTYGYPKTGALWELTYPHSERHGGGSPLLRPYLTTRTEPRADQPAFVCHTTDTRSRRQATSRRTGRPAQITVNPSNDIASQAASGYP